jgi:hypothetical protein
MKNKFMLLVVLVSFSLFVNAQYLNLSNIEKQHRGGLDYQKEQTQFSKTTEIWSEDFEGGVMPTGWSEQLGSATQGWSFSADASSDYLEFPAHTVYASINDDECNCDMSDVWLITPEIDLSTASAPKLSFESYLILYEGTFTLKASIDAGTTWEDVTTFTTQEVWTEEVVSLIDYAGETVTLAFHYNDGGAWDYGWAIDDVVVFEPDAHDLGIVGISPAIVVTGQSVTPEVVVANYGANAESTWSVQLTDGAGYTEVVSDAATIEIGGDYTVVFPEWTPADGTYSLTATVTLAEDAVVDNNVFTGEVSVGDYILAHAANSNGVSGSFYLGTSFWNTEYIDGPEIYGGTYINDKLYGVTSDLDFGYFDENAEVWTQVGATGITGETFVISMAYDPIENQIYTMGLSGSYPAFTIKFYSIDISTGVASLVATSPQTGTLLAIAFDTNGDLYGIMHNQTGNGTFQLIDKTTGALWEVGDMGQAVSSYFQSMAFDFETNVCYFQAFDDEGGFNGTFDINRSTGAATQIGAEVMPTQITAFGIPYTFVSTESKLTESSINVYPNPAGNVLYLENVENSTISVFNMMGQRIMMKDAANRIENLDVSELSNGTYIIQIENEFEMVTHKFNVIH